MPISRPQTRQVPVIDLFAGPGGLGEGFSAFEDDRLSFDVVLSVEKDGAAHSTLVLRAFFRALRARGNAERYYSYIRGDITAEELYAAFPDEAANAKLRCLHLEMSPRTTSGVYGHLERALAGSDTWVLVGGPPCQAYSVAGRSRLSRLDRGEFEQNEKHVLYREYLRVLARYLPPIFVVENVRGLLSATYGGKSTFARMISDLSSPTVAVRESMTTPAPVTRRDTEYSILSFANPASMADDLRPEDYVIEAEKFGIPQRRHRVILFGIRSDLTIPRGLVLQSRPGPSVGTMLSDLPLLRSRLSQVDDGPGAWADAIRRGASSLASDQSESAVGQAMGSALRCLRQQASSGGRFVPYEPGGTVRQSPLAKWMLDPLMAGIANHEARKHMQNDLTRYLFASSFASVHGWSPKLHEFPPGLLPNHRNAADAGLKRRVQFNDRFRVQVAHESATTVTSHISKDGHYFIHHDPTQCRSWTVREAARAQTFPDNYFFEGTRTDQYRQVGNAVPPYLAVQIAGIIAACLRAQ